ncbi:DNA-3-methyladenine glycosylase [Candidatus Woesearchaeota archaeon]|nr:DNA-3-methyladenine glycosylase [Candidatus Woesearchaeota archaeon]
MHLKTLPKSFFNKSTIEIARNLLGKYLVHKNLVGKIVETEAYLKNDPASHAFKGKTERNKSVFGKPGISYVYFTYGMHYCFNVVTNKGFGEAILIRALEPVEGVEVMKKNRKTNDLKNLCSGPAKLTIALEITRNEDGADLLSKNSDLKLMQGKKENFKIVSTQRIGISQAKEKLLRFYIKGSEFVSRK